MKRYLLILILMYIVPFALYGCGGSGLGGLYQRGQDTQQDKPVSSSKASESTEVIKDGPGFEEVQSITITESNDEKMTARGGINDASAPKIKDIYFEYDRYEIRPEFLPYMREISNWLLRSRTVMLIEGHCDDRGTNEYNLALGDRRAVSVKDFLLASGVPYYQLETMSYGEERPLCNEQDEKCWSRNRRAHFVIGASK